MSRCNCEGMANTRRVCVRVCVCEGVCMCEGVYMCEGV